jgi:hypothetical protein
MIGGHGGSTPPGNALNRGYNRSGHNQGSFFRLQNTEGLTLVGLLMEGTTLTCLETYSDTKKKTLATTQPMYEQMHTQQDMNHIYYHTPR